ncbi:hypothetical protein GUITHDRAFT_150879, partial [Guillardia theta CCMP2712]
MRTLLLRRLSTLYFCCLLLASSASVRRVASLTLAFGRHLLLLHSASSASVRRVASPHLGLRSPPTFSPYLELSSSSVRARPVFFLALALLFLHVFLFFVIFPHLHPQSVLLVHLQRAGQHMHLCEFTQCYEQEA